MRQLSYPNIVSTIALVVSAGALLISYLQYTSNFEQTELHWKMVDISIKNIESESKFQIISNVDFAVRNASNSALHLASCNFRLRNARLGHGGWEPRLIPCPKFQGKLKEGGPIVVEPGQTIFLNEEMSFLGDSDNFMAAMERLGIHPSKDMDNVIPASIKECSTGFSLRSESESFGGTCLILDGAKLFTLSLQTGTGKYIEGEFTFGFQEKNWPWQRSKL
jgi:hypothetical protein